MNTSAYWTSVLDEFVRYFERYAPGLGQTIVGASEARIEAAEHLVGVQFPPEYRAFLQAMGDTPEGALGPFLEHVKFGIEALEEFYRTPGLCPPRDAVYLWTYEFDTPYDIFIEMRGGERDKRGLLQAGWAVDEETGALRGEEPALLPLEGSLLRSLYTDAFLHLRAPLLPQAAQLRDRANADLSDRVQAKLRADFQLVAERLGFEAVPFVDGDQIFYDRPDASLKLYAQRGANVVYVRGADEGELGRLREVLSDNLGMAIWR